MEKLQQLYTDYYEAARQVRKKAKVFDGVFGMGNDPRNHPCHDEFFQKTGQWAAELADSRPEQAELMAAANYILEAPLKYQKEECFFYMFAAHNHLKPLIPLLSKENCRVLQARFEKLYPKRDRLPLQQELLKMLVKAGK